MAKFVDALKGMALAVPGMSAVAGALSSIGGALATISAPAWGLIAVGVAAVAAAGGLLWRYWDRVSSVVKGVALAIGDQLAPIIEAAGPIFEPFAQSARAIGDAFAWVGEQISAAAGWLGSFFEQEVLTDGQKASLEASARDVTNKIINVMKAGAAALFEVGAQMIQSLWDGIVSKIEALIEWVKTIPSRITAAFGRIDLSNAISLGGLFGGSSGDTPPAVDGARAAGGPVTAGGTYLVGEEGPELFTAGRSGSIWPNRETIAALRASSAEPTGTRPHADGAPQLVSPTINLGGITINGVQDIRGSIDEIERLLNDRFRDFVRSLHLA